MTFVYSAPDPFFAFAITTASIAKFPQSLRPMGWYQTDYHGAEPFP